MSKIVRLGSADPGTARGLLWRLLLAIGKARKLVISALLLPRALARYDAFVLEGRDLFFDGRGLWLLRLFRKRVVVLFLGTDHRPPYMSGTGLAQARVRGNRWLAKRTSQTAARVRRAERYADTIIALPTSAQFHSIPFVHLLAVGLPVPVMNELARPPAGPAVRILHSPSNTAAKGTRRFEEVVSSLQARGLKVQLELLHGVPHHQVLDALRRCDFVVDELYSDSPMAVFAAEAASLARPAVIGGYASKAFKDLHVDDLPPTRYCHPNDVDKAIEELVVDAKARQTLGSKARDFVVGRWNPEAVAERMQRILAGQLDPRWLVDPAQIQYVNGWGCSDEQLRDGVAAFIAERGADDLQLRTRPDLIAALQRLAAGEGR